jgi:hypothetical protein
MSDDAQLSMDFDAVPPSLGETLGVPVDVSPRLRRGWRLVREASGARLVIPPRLEEAPGEVREALSDWVATVLRPSPGSRHRRRVAARAVFAWMGDAGERIPREASRGRFFDLRPHFDQLNRQYFQGRLSAILRWTPRAGATSTHRKAGGCDVITISRRFDGPKVPPEALWGVLSHEMLHIELPPTGEGLRRNVHHRAFREAERAFPFHRAWMAWEKEQALRPWWKRILRRSR